MYSGRRRAERGSTPAGTAAGHGRHPAVPSPHTPSGPSRQKQAATAKRRGPHSRAASRPRHSAFPPGAGGKKERKARQPGMLSLEEVMQLNHTAMESLRQGRTGESHAALVYALEVAEGEVQHLQAKLEAASAGEKEVTESLLQEMKHSLEAWLLTYAATLSNLGCELRREGKAAEALVCLRDARDVEATVTHGKPSCSTMLNLSAVLLGMGAVTEALPIAKDCVAAAQQGDHILFITALHNLAVTLGQQPSERERSAALPTMLRALREAQEFLGEEHPTTVMLKERCATTHQWVLSEERPPQQQELQEPPTLRTIATLPSATHPPTLTGGGGGGRSQSRNFVAASGRKPPVNLAPLGTINSSAQSLRGAAHTAPVRAHPDGERCTGAAGTLGPVSNLHAQEAWPSVPIMEPPPPPPRPVPRGEEETPTSGGLAATTVYQEQATTSNGSVASDDGAASTRPIVECDRRLSADLTGSRDSRDSSTKAVAVMEARLAEESVSSGTDGTTVPPGSEGKPSVWASGQQVNLHAIRQQQPSFLRFAAPEDRQTTGPQPSENVYMTYQHIRETLRRHRRATAQSTNETPEATTSARARCISAHGSDARAAPNETEADAPSAAAPPTRERSTVVRSREERLAIELREEEAYRHRKALQDAAAQAETAFQTALTAIMDRTRDRAARRIQLAWSPWWQQVGRPRREAQLRRAEERERRLRERLAAMADGTRLEQQQQQHGRDGVPASHKERAGRFVAPGVVVRCGMHWLARTAGVRYLARHGLQRGPSTSRDPTRTRYAEAAVQATVTRIQALWRGALVRKHLEATNATITTREAEQQQQQRQQTQEEEERAYAALVIQKLVRCRIARKAKQARFLEVYTPAAVTIQSWYRATLKDQQRRGTDARTVRTRNAAALTIQCAWHCFQAKLRRYVELVKRQIRLLRWQEAEAHRIAYERDELLRIEARREREAEDTAIAEREGREMALAEATSARLRAAELARGPGFVSAFSGKFYPDIPIRNSKYEEECLERIYTVHRSQENDREAQDVPLHLEPATERARQEAMDRIRLRPFVVARLRAAEELRCEEELYAVRRHYAAVRIQREFRTWLRHRDNPGRDTTLLLISRGKYQQAGLARQVQRKQRRREQERCAGILADQVHTVRETLEATRHELTEEEEAEVDGAAPSRPRSREQRWEKEKALRKAERIVSSTYPRDLANLRRVVYHSSYGGTTVDPD